MEMNVLQENMLATANGCDKMFAEMARLPGHLICSSFAAGEIFIAEQSIELELGLPDRWTEKCPYSQRHQAGHFMAAASKSPRKGGKKGRGKGQVQNQTGGKDPQNKDMGKARR